MRQTVSISGHRRVSALESSKNWSRFRCFTWSKLKTTNVCYGAPNTAFFLLFFYIIFEILGGFGRFMCYFLLFVKILPFPLLFCIQKPLQSTQHPKKWVVRHKNRPNRSNSSKVMTAISTMQQVPFCSL